MPEFSPRAKVTLAGGALAITALVGVLTRSLWMPSPAPPPEAVAAPVVEPPNVTPRLLWPVARYTPAAPQHTPDGAAIVVEMPAAFGAIALEVVPVGDAPPDALRPIAPEGSRGGGRLRILQHASFTASGALVAEAVEERQQSRRLVWVAPGASHAVRLVDPLEVGGDPIEPAVDAAGRLIAFVVERSGNADVFVLDQRSKRLRELVTSPADEREPRFTRDGRAVLVTREIGPGDTDVVAIDVARGREAVVAGGPGRQERAVPITGGAVAWFSGSDGQRGVLYAGPVGGGAPIELARDVRLPARGGPAVSPDGRFVAARAADDDHAVIVATADGQRRVVVRAPAPVGEPSLGQRDGRLRLAWVGGGDDPGVYDADITDLVSGRAPEAALPATAAVTGAPATPPAPEDSDDAPAAAAAPDGGS